MAITHTAPPIGKNTDRLNQEAKAARKPGVSPKFISTIVRNTEAQTSEDAKPSAS